MRRKFYDLQVAHASALAAEALKRIAELYVIESEIRGRPPDERLQIRITRACALLDSLHQWLESTLAVYVEWSMHKLGIGIQREISGLAIKQLSEEQFGAAICFPPKLEAHISRRLRWGT